MAITAIAQLPFEQRDPLALLALDRERLAPDADYAGFGWAEVERVVLTAPDRPELELERAVIVALHSADAQPEGDDIELLFELPAQSVIVPLSRFLPHALAQLPAGRPVVLALCNPRKVAVTADGRPLYYAAGDVTSWLDRDAHGAASLRLSARRWNLAKATP